MGGNRAAVREKYAPVVEEDDAVAQQAPALSGLVCHGPRRDVIRCPPSGASGLMLAHDSFRSVELSDSRLPGMRGSHQFPPHTPRPSPYSAAQSCSASPDWPAIGDAGPSSRGQQP